SKYRDKYGKRIRRKKKELSTRGNQEVNLDEQAASEGNHRSDEGTDQNEDADDGERPQQRRKRARIDEDVNEELPNNRATKRARRSRIIESDDDEDSEANRPRRPISG